MILYVGTHNHEQERGVEFCFMTHFFTYIMHSCVLCAVGHNLGGSHPFYDEEFIPQGRTGGLMDYGWYGYREGEWCTGTRGEGGEEIIRF